ncbi:MAG: RluA family pseudouridine synthase [Candidatus Shapirobacteria bacterium]|nr:RluA family pseudouridine synthase [Candidatus Shapirobacteria bacterium]MDD5073799.1 RluA family pseudouridine synthase [Candidatus Shapirobacteria bacterium]MDD5481516.1 RluA family pseudouridine synthase [Candidatus Shapirobacteria bacterium]
MTGLVKETSQPGIIYQDNFLLVLNKPPFWVVNRAQTTKGKITVEDWLENNFTFETIKKGNLRAGIAHRLDKDTSGVLLIGKTIKSLAKIQEQFFHRTVKKRYSALVHDIFPDDSQVMAPINRLPRDREKFGVVLGGKKAKTNFLRRAIYQRAGERFSLIWAFPKTGRTHQIRVHCQYLGHPIVADPNYVGRKRLRKDFLWCSRIFLHASAISFDHPETGEKISFQASLPKDLALALKKLEKA